MQLQHVCVGGHMDGHKVYPQQVKDGAYSQAIHSRLYRTGMKHHDSNDEVSFLHWLPHEGKGGEIAVHYKLGEDKKLHYVSREKL